MTQSSQKMHDLLNAVTAGQPPIWGVGVEVSQRFLNALMLDPHPSCKATASLLVSNVALMKLEGYGAGIFSLQEELIKRIDEGASIEEVRTFLETQQQELTAAAGSLYSGIFSGLATYIHQLAPLTHAESLEGLGDVMKKFIDDTIAAMGSGDAPHPALNDV